MLQYKYIALAAAVSGGGDMQHSLIRTLTKLTFVVGLLVWACAILIPISPSSLTVITAEAQAFPPGITPPPPIQGPPRPSVPATAVDFAPGPTTDQSVRGAARLNALEAERRAAANNGADPAAALPTPVAAVQIEYGNRINSFLHAFVVTYVGWLMAHAGAFFDYTFREFIIGFGENFNTSNTGWAVQQVWGTVRDVFNLTFIFGIIYIGFRLILNGDDSRAKSTLVTLLAAALLVNFSLFITKFVIDVANITATEIARSVQPIEAGSVVGGTGTTTLASGGFGELFMNYLGLSSALEVGVNGGVNNMNVGMRDGKLDFTDSEASLGYIFGLLLLFLITAFVFLAGAVMVTIRFFVLLIYMIFSPFMFLGWVFPNFAGVSSKWWSGFLGKAFFAPAYVFMLYITLLLMTQYAEGRPEAATDMGMLFGSRQADQAGEAFAYFALVITSLLASLVIAQKMGATGATTAIAVGQRMRRSGQSFIGRNTVGRAVPYVTNKLDTVGNAYNDRMSQTRIGRNTASLLRAGAAVATVGASEVVLNRRNINAVGKSAKDSKFGGSYSRTDDETYDTQETQKQKARIAARTASTDLPELIKLQDKETAGTISSTELDRLRQLRGDKKNSSGTWTVGDGEQKMRSTISGLTTTQVENLSQKEREAISSLFESGQFDKILESKEISDGDKEKMVEARQKAIKDTLVGTSGIITSELVKLTTTQLETLGAGFIAENAHLLSHSQLDEIKKSKKFTDAQKNSFGANRKSKHASYITTVVGAKQIFQQKNSRGIYESRKATEVAQLGEDILTSDIAFNNFLNVDILEAILNKQTLGVSARNKIKNKLRAPSTDPRVIDMKNWLITSMGQRF